jgi:hypothetical protein
MQDFSDTTHLILTGLRSQESQVKPLDDVVTESMRESAAPNMILPASGSVAGN